MHHLRIGAPGAIVAASLLASALPAQDPAVQPGDARALLERWVETRRVISKEQQEWAIGKDVLSSRIELVQREIATLRAAIGEAEAGLARVETQRAELLAEKARFEQDALALAEKAGALEMRTQELLARAPEPIRERVKPLSQRLPTAPGHTEASLPQRFQDIAGILNELNRFQREITVASEVRAVGNGTSAEVTAFYVGLGQAWYAGTGGPWAGIGHSTPDGWVWTPDTGALAEIGAAVSISRNEQPARFVRLPIRVD